MDGWMESQHSAHNFCSLCRSLSPALCDNLSVLFCSAWVRPSLSFLSKAVAVNMSFEDARLTK